MRQEELEEAMVYVVGQDKAKAAAKAIMEKWGGGIEWIPGRNDQKRKLADRNRKIRQLFRSGLDIREIAERFGVHEKTVRRTVGL